MMPSLTNNRLLLVHTGPVLLLLCSLISPFHRNFDCVSPWDSWFRMLSFQLDIYARLVLLGKLCSWTDREHLLNLHLVFP